MHVYIMYVVAFKLMYVCVYRPLNYLSLRWYKMSGVGNDRRTRIISDNIKYVVSLYGRVLTIREPTRQDSGVYQCEAVFSRPGSQSSTSVDAEAVLTVYGKYIGRVFLLVTGHF